jgi:phosphate transport system substrate-binding protein
MERNLKPPTGSWLPVRRCALPGIVIAVALVATLSGCAGQVVPRDEAPERAGIRVSGSGACAPLLELLAESYGDDGVSWGFVPGLHSGGGIRGVHEGTFDVGAVSRRLTDEELALGLVYTPLSSDGLVVAVHPSVTIDGLTTAQVRDIYAGDCDNWQQLGGPNLPITVLDRNEDESAKMIFRESVLGPDLAISPRAASLYTEGDLMDGLQSTAGAIGYCSLGRAVSEAAPVRLLALDGVDATVESVGNGTYKMVRPLGVVTRPDASPQVKAFLQWVRSEQAAEFIELNGYAVAR